MYKNSFVHQLTKVLVDIMFFGGIVFCVALPFIMPWLAEYFGYPQMVIFPFTLILMAAGLCALYILLQLKALFKTLVGGDPFVMENVSCLRKSAVACFLIAIIFVIKMFFWPTMTTMLIFIIFTLMGLFALTMKDVFKQAVAYKVENDWTV